MDFQLRALRKEKGLRQEDIAIAANTTSRVVGAWERGETAISLEDAALVADILGCSLDELAGREWRGASYSDPQQERLNVKYESVTDSGKKRIADIADDIAGNPAYMPGRAQGDTVPEAKSA